MSAQEQVIKKQELVIKELREALDSLACHVDEDIPAEDGTHHLWEAVRNAHNLVCGPTSVYVTQDPEFDKRSL